MLLLVDIWFWPVYCVKQTRSVKSYKPATQCGPCKWPVHRVMTLLGNKVAYYVLYNGLLLWEKEERRRGGSRSGQTEVLCSCMAAVAKPVTLPTVGTARLSLVSDSRRVGRTPLTAASSLFNVPALQCRLNMGSLAYAIQTHCLYSLADHNSTQTEHVSTS